MNGKELCSKTNDINQLKDTLENVTAPFYFLKYDYIVWKNSFKYIEKERKFDRI